jgi:tyrosyl-tRNA synthetase
MAGKMVKQGGLYVNNNRITDSDTKLTLKQTLGESLLLLRTGKKSQFLVRIV